MIKNNKMKIKYIYIFPFMVFSLISLNTVFSQVLNKELVFIFSKENCNIFQSEKQNHLDFYVFDILNDQQINDLIKNFKSDNKVINFTISNEKNDNQRKASINFSEQIDIKYFKSLLIANNIKGIIINNKYCFVQHIDNDNYYNINYPNNTVEWYDKRIEDILTKVYWVKQNAEEFNKATDYGWFQQANNALKKAEAEREFFLNSKK